MPLDFKKIPDSPRNQYGAENLIHQGMFGHLLIGGKPPVPKTPETKPQQHQGKNIGAHPGRCDIFFFIFFHGNPHCMKGLSQGFLFIIFHWILEAMVKKDWQFSIERSIFQG